LKIIFTTKSFTGNKDKKILKASKRKNFYLQQNLTKKNLLALNRKFLFEIIFRSVFFLFFLPTNTHLNIFKHFRFPFLFPEIIFFLENLSNVLMRGTNGNFHLSSIFIYRLSEINILEIFESCKIIILAEKKKISNILEL